MEFMRQRDIVNMERLKNLPILVVGAGSIGSFLVFALSKMGVERIRVVDFDFVEDHNIPNQCYRIEDEKKSKVSSLKEIIKDFAGIEIEIFEEEYKKDLFFDEAQVVISAVDSMKVRKQIFEDCKYNPKILRFIDTRMGGLSIEILNVNPSSPDEIEFYESRLFSDSEAERIPCTARGIIYSVLTCASIVCDIIKRMIMREKMNKRFLVDYTNNTFVSLGE